ncbi:MAG: hypothetical protein WA208_02770 [Thermoanaerobaculia bacterium]
MSFTVEKSLGNNQFRFAVARRRELRSIDNDRDLSTGPSGEFVRHRPEIFYAADLRTLHKPEVPVARSAVTGTPFWSSLADGTGRGKAYIAAMVIGALFLLLGLLNLAQGKAAPGWVPTILGIVIIAVPIALTGQKRRSLRQIEESKRREREDRDKRNAELLAVYTGSLDRLREDPTDEALASVERESEKLDLPYAVWADAAIGTVLYVGFSTLAKVGPDRSGEVAGLMDRASNAAGLIQEDAIGVKHALYSTVLWHYLADDRLGEEQLRIIRAIQVGFGIDPEDVPLETAAEAQFERLRGIDHRNAPRCTDATLPLKMNEYCVYTTEVRSDDDGPCTVYVTSKRLVVGTESKKVEIPVGNIDDILLDADRFRITVRAAELKRPIVFGAEQPIYLAAMIDLATRLDDRPKSFQ